MDFDITSIRNVLFDKDYQEHISKSAESILGKKESISFKDLKNNSIFKKCYDKLDDKGKATVEHIAGLEDDAKNVTEKELKVILTAMDANLENNAFHFDGKPSLSKTGGLNEANNDELKAIFDYTKTRADIRAEKEKKLAQQREKNAKIKTALEQTKNLKVYNQNGRVNGSNWAKALQIINKNISDGEDWNSTFEKVLGKGNVISQDMLRDGGTQMWKLKDGTTILLNNAQGDGENSSRIGYVTIKYNNGNMECFKPDGTKTNVDEWSAHMVDIFSKIKD